MKMIFVGQGPFGEKVLDRLLQEGGTFQAVFCPKGRSGDPVQAIAREAKLPVQRPDHMRDQEVLEVFQACSPDLVILAFVTDILPEALLDIPVQGTICFHPSLLPKHRGASAINWAVLQGEARTGLTILWADKGIDTGPILLQKEVRIEAEDTTGSLYFNKLFPLGVEAMQEAVSLIKKGRAPRLDQDESRSSYEPPCDDSVAEIHWNRSSREIYNLIRGCDPQPGAYSTIKGQKVRFYGARLSEKTSGHLPGEILDVHQDGLELALDQGTLLIGKMRGQEGGKVSARECAQQLKLQPGMRFGV